MTGVVAAALAALAAGLLAGARPSVVSARLAPVRGQARQAAAVRPRAGAAWRRAIPNRITNRIVSRSRASRREADVVEACLALGAELQAGTTAARALAVVAEEWPELFAAAAARASFGGNVVEAIRASAATPGAASLRAVAAGWEVTDQTGAPLSRIVVAVADSLRTDVAVRREAHSQLATARATARLLAALPFGTLVLLSGGDRAAFAFLLSTPVGLGCLGGAVLFVAAGMWWVGRLTRSATRSAWEE